MSTKAGARNAAQDKARIREIRKLAGGIHGLTVELEPDDDDAPQEKSLRRPDTTVGIKAVTDDTVTVTGYGVIFGGMDLEGETFGPETDYMLDLVPTKPILYDHGLADVKHFIGKAITVEADDYGLWVEAELDRHQSYVEQIMRLAEKGALGWSSGTAGHLAVREGKSIRRWPIVEFSLTPTPAEPRTLGVEVIKSLAEIDESFGALLPEDARPASVQGADDDATKAAATIVWNTEESNMDNEQKQQTADLSAVLAAIQAQGDTIKALADKVSGLESAPPVKAVGHAVTVVQDEADKQAGNWKSFGEFLLAVKGHAQNVPDPRLLALRSNEPMDEGGFSLTKAMGAGFVGGLRATKAAPTDLGESIPQAGGFLVGSDRQTSILSRVYDIGALLQRVAMDGVGPNSNGMTYYAEDETSRATGSRRGGVRFYWMAENSAVTTSNPTFREMELKLKKAAAACYVTEELLQDATALESYIQRVLPEEIRWGVEDGIVNGTGTGQPLGILNGPALVTVAKETGQANDTIVYNNILKMWARLWNRSRSNAIWLINQDCIPQLSVMTIPVGTAGVPVYLPPGGASGQMYGTLFNRPVIEHESCDTVGDLGDIILADLSQYQMIEKGGIQSASSIHVRFLEGETCYRFIYRVDGQPMWSSALTPTNSTNTVSPFVALAAR